MWVIYFRLDCSVWTVLRTINSSKDMFGSPCICILQMFDSVTFQGDVVVQQNGLPSSEDGRGRGGSSPMCSVYLWKWWLSILSAKASRRLKEYRSRSPASPSVRLWKLMSCFTQLPNNSWGKQLRKLSRPFFRHWRDIWEPY